MISKFSSIYNLNPPEIEEIFEPDDFAGFKTDFELNEEYNLLFNEHDERFPAQEEEILNEILLHEPEVPDYDNCL